MRGSAANASDRQWTGRDGDINGERISRDARRNGFLRQGRIQRDGNKCHKEGLERNSARGRKAGSLGASEGVWLDPLLPVSAAGTRPRGAACGRGPQPPGPAHPRPSASGRGRGERRWERDRGGTPPFPGCPRPLGQGPEPRPVLPKPLVCHGTWAGVRHSRPARARARATADRHPHPPPPVPPPSSLCLRRPSLAPPLRSHTPTQRAADSALCQCQPPFRRSLPGTDSRGMHCQARPPFRGL